MKKLFLFVRKLSRYGNFGIWTFHKLRHGIPICDIVRDKFPRLSNSPQKPGHLCIEFTNHCNLRCVYCPNAYGIRETGMMDYATFSNVIDSIKMLRIHNVKVIGGGEPTLHPNFGDFLSELALSTKYVSVLTNGQWDNPRQIIHCFLKAPVNLIEISVESTAREEYEKSNKGGSFAKLLSNLRLLKRIRDNYKSRSIINLRVMVRPSDRGRKHKLSTFWKSYCDTMLFQQLRQYPGLEGVEDLYKPVRQDERVNGQCAFPLRKLDFNWDGNIPLCSYSVYQYGSPGYILGNINNENLRDIWNSNILTTYRRTYREGSLCQLEFCRDCPVGSKMFAITK